MRLENNAYVVEFTTLGGEILSMTHKASDVQIMYQGDQGWKGKNPTLFPLVGNTLSKTYEIDGTTYAMPNHGLIRTRELQVRELTSTSICFGLRADATTLAQYPFDFDYEITYTLEADGLDISYRILNLGKTTMCFGFGLHPGFRMPLLAKETARDYQLLFPKAMQATQLVFDVERKTPIQRTVGSWNRLTLTPDVFARYDTLLFGDVAVDEVVLAGPTLGIKLTMRDFPYLAIWNDQTSDFVCIEPWLTLPDLEPHNHAFCEREGMQQLEMEQTFKISYKIGVIVQK
ncbi:MAG: aldose 1-epimerase family protein [Erysipelotrichaceae bacterium]